MSESADQPQIIDIRLEDGMSPEELVAWRDEQAAAIRKNLEEFAKDSV